MSISRKSRLTRKSKAGIVATTVGAMAIALTTQWEGIRLVAYQDVIGVWTACQGVTKGIKPGMVFTREECDVLFMDELIKHEEGLRNCLRNPDAIPRKSYVSFVSWTYNVGVGAACRSTLVKKANADDLEGACNELPKWKFAGKGKKRRVVKGLVNRRADEQRLCLEGVREGDRVTIEPYPYPTKS